MNPNSRRGSFRSGSVWLGLQKSDLRFRDGFPFVRSRSLAHALIPGETTMTPNPDRRLLALRIRHAALCNVIEGRKIRHKPRAFLRGYLNLATTKLIQHEMKMDLDNANDRAAFHRMQQWSSSES